MRFEKAIVPVSVSVAVVVAAIAAIVVTSNRAAVARAEATAAKSQAAATNAWYKAVKAEAIKAEANKEAERQNARAKADELEANRLAKETADRKDETAEKERETQRLANDTAKQEAKKASDLKEAEQAKAKAAKAELDKKREQIAGELALSNAAARDAEAKLATELRKSEAVIAERRVRELRKIDFDRLERELLEYKQELDERERALHPDVSIYDSSNVTWVAERELDVIGETNRLKRVEKVLPENDPTLPAATRKLAKLDRLSHESSTNRLSASQAKLIGELERLRDAAAREGRVLDVNFYQKSIKSLNPDYKQ